MDRKRGTHGMNNLDSRLHAFRADLAAEHLLGKVEAKKFVAGQPRQVALGRAALRRAPEAKAPLDTELLFGERVQLYDEQDGWAWVQSESDGYVGYTESKTLSTKLLEPTHRVAELATHLYPVPDLKSAPTDWLPMTARVCVGEIEDTFCHLASGGWVYAAHLAPIDAHASDHCDIARKFLDVPYLWGGKTSAGIDCSGLLQVSLASCGKAIRRDSDMQVNAGRAVAYDGDETMLRRGDLVFWHGHAGIWIDPQTFVHANATDMLVASEPLSRVAARIEAASGDAILCMRRI